MFFVNNYQIYLGCGVYLPPRSNRFSSMDPGTGSLPSSHSRPVLQRPIQHHQAARGGGLSNTTDTNHSGPQTDNRSHLGSLFFFIFIFTRSLSHSILMEFQVPFELIYISSDFDHGDVIKASELPLCWWMPEGSFSQQKIHQHHGKMALSGTMFFLISAVAKIWLKFQHFWNLDFHHIPKGFEPIELRIFYLLSISWVHRPTLVHSGNSQSNCSF